MSDRSRTGRRVSPATRRLATVAVAFAGACAISIAGCSHSTITPVPTSASLGATATPASPSSVAPAPVASPSTSISGTPTTAAASARLRPVRITVPAIGVDAVLVTLGLTRDGALAVPTRAMNAGWYTGSPVPGRVGPAIIAGHVHWSGIPAVFAHLAQLRPGDRITVTRSDGSKATFAVDRVATYAKSRFPTELVYGSLAVPGLRLITCGGYDPVARAYEANVIVFASLSRA